MNARNRKNSQRLTRMLSDIASKGGNLLLNIGPRADGSIPQESIDRLEAIARWMDVNSEAEIAAIKPARLALKLGEATHTAGIPATGDGLTWKTVPLGEIELPEDEAVIEFKPDPEHWNPIQLRTVTLTPAKR